MPITPRYLIACYNSEGDHQGYYTTRDTLTSIPAKALWAVSSKSAEEELARLQLETRTGWSQYVWVVEKVAPQDMGDADDSTPDRLLKDGKLVTKETAARSTTVVDTKEEKPLPSVPRTRTTNKLSADKPTNKETKMAKAKAKKTRAVKSKPAKAVPAAKKEALADKLAKLREKAAAKKSSSSKKAVAAAKSRAKVNPATLTKRTATQRPKNVPCLCGCGGKTEKFFLRGHVFKYNKYLGEIARGEAKPSTHFPPEQIEAMGPWLNTKAGGKKPTTSLPAKVRAKLSSAI